MLNKCIFIGKVLNSPVLRETKNGTKVINTDIEVKTEFTDKQKNIKVQTENIPLIAFQDRAIRIYETIKMGDLMYIDGKFRVRQEEKENGSITIKTEILIDNFNNLGGQA